MEFKKKDNGKEKTKITRNKQNIVTHHYTNISNNVILA